MTGPLHAVARGAVAGAAGTTALDMATYADMAWRGRPASSTPKETVARLADLANVEVPGEGEQRDNRLSGLGALSGNATGVAVGALYGVVHALGVRPPLWAATILVGGAAMAVSDVSAVRLGVSDVRSWTPRDWASDVVPHLVYGAVTALVVERAGRSSASARL